MSPLVLISPASYPAHVYMPQNLPFSMKILDIPSENRPRERLQALGPSALSDAELLAIILKTGNKGENVIDMSNRLFSKYCLGKLSGCSLVELQEIKGIGGAKACQIQALFELGRRQSRANVLSKPLNSPKDVFDYLSPRMSHLEQEHFVVLLLDSKNRVKKEETVFIGTLNSSTIHPREIFKSAIKESANAIIVAHNHPSGDPTPSEEDKEITKQIVKVGHELNIEILDHVIIGGRLHESLIRNE